MNLQEVITHVAQRPEVRSSLTDLFRGLAELIREHQDEPLKLEALADDLDDSRETVALAVVANTPVAPSGIGAGSRTIGPDQLTKTGEPFFLKPPAAVAEGFESVGANQYRDPASPPPSPFPSHALGRRLDSEGVPGGAAEAILAAEKGYEAKAALEVENRLEEQRDRIAEKTSGEAK